MTDEYKFKITGKDATGRAFKAIQRNLVAVRGAINSTHVQVGLMAGASGLGFLVARSLSVNDSLAKMADRVNASTEGLAALRHQTELNGESSATLDKSLEKMRRSLGEVDQGVGEAKDAMKLLGINMDDIRDLKADEQFELIGTAIGSLSDANQQAAISSDIFGRSGVKLINVFNQGAEGFASAREEADRLGISMSRVDAAKIEEANDSMLRSRQAVEGLGNKITVQLAPIIAAMSDEFVEAATSGDNMTGIVETGFRTGAKVAGTFADGIHGVQIVLKGAEVAATGFGAAFIGSVDLIQTSIFKFADAIKHNLILPFKGWLEIAALIPGISDQANAALQSINATLAQEWTPPPGVHETFLQLRDGLSGAREELHAMMMEDLPSAVIDEKLSEILAIAEEKAVAAAARVAQRSGVGVDEEGADGSSAAEQEKTQQRLDRLNEQYLTEYEMLSLKLANEQALLDEAKAGNLLTEQEFHDKSLRATSRYEDEKSKLEKKAAAAKKAIISGTLSSIAQIAGGENKKLFGIQKAASLAQAVVALPAAVIESFKNAGGYPWGIAPAAAMAAAGAKQIATIKSSSFGGGGSGSGVGAIGGGGSGSSGTPAIDSSLGRAFDPETAVAGSGQNITIQIAGDVYSQDAEQFTDKIVSAVQKYTDADGILFLNNSAQAVELA